ncbi:MAG TPA: PSD1 and planctomycete cytochrome C domain-containing protein [Terriglobia bacterium]|nr:PSD1 and planctomycete cytochrome C domain-containing protein [Terriglobia bacterium]
MLILALMLFEGGKVRGQNSKAPAPPPPARSRTVDYQRDIAPIFRASCEKCHGDKDVQAKLRLDSLTSILQGGTSGKIIIPGNSADSLLVKRLLGLADAPRMPFGADPLPRSQIDLIRAWIDHGKFGSANTNTHGQDARAAEELRADHTQEASASVEVKLAHWPAATDSGLFAAKIRPIFAERCYQCHGANLHQNGLRLDSLAAALKGSDSGKVIVPGDSENSRMVRRLLALDRPQMPYGGPPLPAEEIKLIRNWIDSGAKGPDSNQPIASGKPVKHWAYIKPVRPELPRVNDTAWCRNPIDYFVLARLEKEGLKPSPEADKETLIRRVSLDLIGLPPTPQEVDAFLANQSPDAYEKLVDRLLASPHYGEKWAAPWLDLARYADSNGYEKDDLRVAWKYRDWVIDALNQDMSFKEFTIEQIAGDMLPNPTTDQLIATGFHRNTMLNEEGGVDHEEYRFYSLIDRANTTASVWLGLTLGCAQCHNHKFDPFTQKNYYQFLAFFDNVEYKNLNLGQGEGHIQEPELELPTPEQAKRAREIRGEISKLQSVLDTGTPELESAQTKWEQETRAAEGQWAVLVPSHVTSEGGATLTLLPDHSVLAGGKNPDADTYSFDANTDLSGITGVRLEVLGDSSFPNGGPGRDADGNFFLSDFELEARPANGQGTPQTIAFKTADDDEAQGGYEIKRIFDKKSKPDSVQGWAIDDTLSSKVKRRQAVLVPEKPFGFEAGTLLTIRMKHRMLHAARNIGRFRLSVTTMPEPLKTVQLEARLRPVLDMPAAERSPEQSNQLAEAYRKLAPQLQPTRDQIAKLNKDLKGLGIVTALIVRERPGFERPSTYLHIRGAYLSQGEKVYANVPPILNPLPRDAMPNRLGLAEWLVSDDNPLTARVTVNHFWEQIFGHGIVETAEDFGSQGEPPSHPELLDWLATEFMQDGWSMKKIKRTIVTSATYRQSSRVTPELVERDPYNRLLARGPRFRVDAETVRDIALAASGLLSTKLGGPSVFPYQPEGVWDEPYSGAKWVESSGADRYRRGVYTFIRRTSAYPSLLTFDAPSREFCTVRRVRTNTPLQALTTLNDPAFFEAARALAKRVRKEAGPDAAAQATYAFRLCLSRKPKPTELARVLAFYRQQLEHYKNDPKAAGEVVGAEKTKVASAVPAPSGPADTDLAAWTMVSNVLLNLDETITKQ